MNVDAGLTQIIVGLVVMAVGAMAWWVWMLHDRLNETKVMFIREFVTKETERKLFAELKELGKAISGLSTDVQVIKKQLENDHR